MWAPIVDGLAKEHRVLWFDNRGTGESGSTKDATVADLCADAFAVMDAAGVDAAHVMGVSQGGVVVLEMAMSQPERLRSLIVGCSGALTPDKPRSPAWVSWLIHQIPPKVFFWLGRKKKSPACTPERHAAIQALLREHTSDRRGVFAQSKALDAYRTTLADVAEVQTPTLVIHGTADTAVKYEWGQELDATLPDSRLVTYEGVGHNFVGEVPDQTVADVNGFLAEVDARQETVG